MRNRTFDIIICDDQTICQMGLELSLSTVIHELFEIRKASSGKKLIELIEARKPHLLLLDLGLPDISGLQLIQHIQKTSTVVKIMVVTGSQDQQLLSIVLRSKVNALLSKSHSLEVFGQAVQHLKNPKSSSTFVDPQLRRILEQTQSENLTPREWQVLELIAQGEINRRIAEILNCSIETVKTHRSNLGLKIPARNRSELTAWYLRRKFTSEMESSPASDASC